MNQSGAIGPHIEGMWDHFSNEVERVTVNPRFFNGGWGISDSSKDKRI